MKGVDSSGTQVVTGGPWVVWRKTDDGAALAFSTRWKTLLRKGKGIYLSAFLLLGLDQ